MKFEAVVRTEQGKGASRRLRHAGIRVCFTLLHYVISFLPIEITTPLKP
jgi:hypothetical protein